MTAPLDWTESSSYGIMRGFGVQFVISPFEAIKNRQQCSSKPCFVIAQDMIQKEGYRAFYRGIPYQLMKNCFKQAWIWPVLTELPEVLRQWNIPDLAQQALIGLTIASIETLAVPLEKSKIRSFVHGTNQFYARANKQECIAYWKKLAVHWPCFLVTQQFFRNLHKENPQKPLTLFQIGIVGLEIAVPSSLCTVYFDTKNTLIQAGAQRLPENIFRHSYRILPMHTLIQMIHSVTAVYFLEKLQK